MSKSSRDPYSVGYITCTILPHNMTDQVFTPYSAFFLERLDERMERSGLFYVHFMDDILVLAPTRWRLRKAVKAVNEVLGSLGLLMHPGKTFVGRTERGFDFLG